MRISTWLPVLLCALPLAAQAPAPHRTGAMGSPGATLGPRRVFAPCELTAASLGPSGEDSPTEGRGFAIHIMNGSANPIALPAYPEFGWRVDTLEKKGWKVKAEGGPVRRIRDTDPHLRVVGEPGTGPMVHIAPDFARDYRFFLPGADRALRHEGKLTTLRLSVYWAASAEMQREDPAAPACAIAADWTIRIRPLAAQ